MAAPAAAVGASGSAPPASADAGAAPPSIPTAEAQPLDAGAGNLAILGTTGAPVDLGAPGAPWGDEDGVAAALEGLGGPATSGVGRIGAGGGRGYGTGSGRLGGSRRAGSGGTPAAPRVTAGGAEAQGALAKDAVKRIVHRHLSRIRHCYEMGLVRVPTMAGKVVMRFGIDPSGKVVGAAAEVDELGDPATTICIRQTFASMEFPAPGNGPAIVAHYPLTFRPAEDATAPARDAAAAAPTHLGGKAIPEATLADLQAALRAGGWTVASFTRRPAPQIAAAIVDLEVVRSGLRARIVFRPALREGGPRVTPNEKARLFANGAVTDIGDFYLAVVVDSDPKQAEPLRASLFACCREPARAR